jgi:cbb3-type cytochrome oxidase subunit 3
MISTMCMLSQSCGMMSTMKAGVSWVDGLHQHLMHCYHVSSFALCLFTMCFVVGTLFLFWNSGVHRREDHCSLNISKCMFFMCVILLVLIVLSTKSISNGAQYVTLESRIKCLSLAVLFLATHQ